MTTSALRRLTVDEYLAIERAADSKSEFFDGEMFAMAGGSEAHVLLAGNVRELLRSSLRARGCRAYQSDLRVKAPSGLYTYPDVAVVCGEPQFEGDRRDTLLNPSLVVEVLSPSTEAYDRGQKFKHYRSIPSLRAYLLIASEERSVEQYVRQPDGSWSLTACEAGAIDLPTLGVRLSLDDIYDQVSFPEPPGAVPPAP